MSNLLRNIHQQVGRVLPVLLGQDQNVPERLIVRPVDIWAGDEHSGALLCDGVFTRHGQQMQLHGECWEPVGANTMWLAYLHGFDWLRDLRKVGSAAARQQARALMESWIVQYPRPRFFKNAEFTPWDLNLMGKRLSLWIAHYDFFAADSDPDFQDMFFLSLYRQASFLVKMLDAKDGKNTVWQDMAEDDLLQAAKGMLFCGLAFEGHEVWVHRALDHIADITAHYIKPDGMHISRSAFIALRFLRNLLEIKSALHAGGHPVPDMVQDKIEALVPAVRFFRYADKQFALMQATMCGDVDYIDDVLAQAAIKGRRLKQLKDSGFSKLSVGRTTVMIDHGKSTQHLAPLSFEMNYGKDRVLTNCGSHESHSDWREMLAYMPAHNGLEIVGETLSRQIKIFDCQVKNAADYAYVQAAHDGYVSACGLIHRRRLYLSQDGHDLRGEDAVFAQIPLVQGYMASVRFHIHPKVLVSLVSDGSAALLRLPNGVGWRFHQSGGRLSLEDSVYSGDLGGDPRKTQQLVVHVPVNTEASHLKWALRREGL